jgi:membrane protease YdiL (CAAX protease family)
MPNFSTPQKLLLFGFLIGMLNDVAFWAASGTYGTYLADYASKLVILAALLFFRAQWPANPERRGSPGLLVLLGVGLTLFAVALDPMSEWFPHDWKLFSWPAIENRWLSALDLTLGLALTAFVEELLYRRLALAVLPGTSWQRLLLSSLLFGLIHWGQGYGNAIETALVGLAFAFAYQRTGSLALVIFAHYAVDVILFW